MLQKEIASGGYLLLQDSFILWLIKFLWEQFQERNSQNILNTGRAIRIKAAYQGGQAMITETLDFKLTDI